MTQSACSVIERTQYQSFARKLIRYFGFLGVSFQKEPSILVYAFNYFNFLCFLLLWMHLLLLFLFGDISLADRSETVTYINYFGVGMGKYLGILYHRKRLLHTWRQLEALSPSVETVQHHHLEAYLRVYKMTETFLLSFYKNICAFFLITPVVQSVYAVFTTGHFGFVMAMLLYDIVGIQETYWGYFLYYVFVVYCSVLDGLSITSCDLCLFSSLQQLCLHFDLLSKRILELDAKQQRSERDLKDIIIFHEKILKLVKEVDLIFTPSIACSLMSSTFILCFNTYRMLDSISLIFMIKWFLLLLFEMKQVFFICYFADKLVQTSEKVFNVLYEHNWYEGSEEYKRLMLFVLFATQKPMTLNVAGTYKLSLATLQQVFSYAYQMFAVLKTVS